MKIKLNKALRGYEVGAIINVDEKDYKEKTYWKRRLNDAKIDNCCELYTEKKTNKK